MFEQLFSQSQLNSQHKQVVKKLFETKGFPSKKEENWKYTSLKSWVEKNYVPASAKGAEIKVKSTDTHPVVFINGLFQAKLSQIPKGLTLSVELDNSEPADALSGVGRLASPSINHLKIDENISFERPLEIILISASQAQEAISGFRLKVTVGQNSSVAIFENHIQMGEGTHFIYNEGHYNMAAAAKLEFLQVQDIGKMSFHYSRNLFSIDTNATLRTCVMSLGALQSRSELNVDFNKPGGSAEVLGIYSLTGQQQSDHYTNIRHHVGSCQSQQLYKGLLDGKSRAVFVGGVLIAKDAQKANSEQLNKNLLLSPTAEVNSKPELQIYADDVKAAHGSTIGQLQKEELFYLQSRAIKKDKALNMLSKAFVADVIHRLENKTLLQHAEKALR
jgi:Fe-S cluster assembly protein SufD